MTAMTRRELLKWAGAAGLGAMAGSLAGCGSGGEVAGGERPIRIGFIPLTDCASVAMAHELGLYAKYGVNVVVEKQASWPGHSDRGAGRDQRGYSRC